MQGRQQIPRQARDDNALDTGLRRYDNALQIPRQARDDNAGMDSRRRGDDPVGLDTGLRRYDNAAQILKRVQGDNANTKNNFTKKTSFTHMQSIIKLIRIKATRIMRRLDTGLRRYDNAMQIPASAGMTGRGAGRAMRRVVVVAMIVMMVVSSAPMASAATYTFTQTDWSGGATVNNAVHDTANNQAQQTWQQFSTSTAALEAGVALTVGLAASSTTQTNNGATITGFNLSGASLSQTAISGAEADASVQLATVAGQFGSGADGAVTISTAKNINTDTNGNGGRTCADGISYNVVSLTANTATLSGTPPAGCFSAGDKVMLLNEQGDGTNLDNVGNYEFLNVQSIAGNVVTFTGNKTKYYGNGTVDDINLGIINTENSWESLTSASVRFDGDDVLSNHLVYPSSGDYIFALAVSQYDSDNNYYFPIGIFKAYSISNNNWTSFDPVDPPNVGIGALLYPGSGDYIYAMAGATFLTYSISNNNWTTFNPADAPEAATAGASMVYPGTGDYIYYTPANSIVKLWAYSISNNSWATFNPADLNQGGVFKNKLVYPGSGDYIYSMVSSYSGTMLGSMFAYSISNNSWTTFDPADPGGSFYAHSFTYPGYGNYIYALRGNGTDDMLAYSISNNNWTAFDPTDAPATIGIGGNAATYANGYIYVARGGRTYNFYRYGVRKTHKVVLQRIPQYTDVTINSGGSLTANAWDGTKGGVLAFLASGTVTVNSGGSMTMTGKGYRNGQNGIQGESYNKLGTNLTAANLGGGGNSASGSGGGGYGTAGGSSTGTGGGTYGSDDLAKLFLGSGGGGQNNGNNGAGGGVVYIGGSSIVVSGAMTNSGTAVNNLTGGGSGGSIYLLGGSLSVGSNLVTASGGAGIASGNGGVGRIHLKSNSISGTTSPTADTATLSTSYYSSGTYTSGVMDIGQIGGYTTLAYSATTTAQATLTVDVRSGNVATPDGTWTAWQTGVANGGSISGLSNNRYFQYRANLTTSDELQTPSLNDVTVTYTVYATNQSLTSSKYDTSSTDNVMGSIAWDEDSSLPTGTTVTVSLRTASSSVALDAATWYGFTASSTNCTKTDITVSCPSSALASAAASLSDGVNDQWYQYKVLVTSTGVNTPTIPEVRVQYVVNAPPDFTAVSAVQIATSSDANWGKVQINYSVRDIDTETGSITPGYVTPTFEYNIGGGWVAIDEVYLSEGALSNKIVTQIGYAGYGATWDAKTHIPGQYIAGAQIRITANDNEPANNTAQTTTAGFALDTKVPTASGTINGTTNEIVYSVADDGLVSYQLSNNSDGSYDSVNASSGVAIATGATSTTATTTWVLAGSPSNQRVYLSAIDAYGNTASTTIVGPVAPTYFDLKDTSNVLIENYQIFLSWQAYSATTSASFNRYELYRSTDGSAYALQNTITNSATNYYADQNLASSTTYYYKLLTVDGDGDVSPYSTALNHQPSGQGGTDATPPTLSAITVAEYQSTYAKITFTTNELAFGAVEYAAAGGTPYSLSKESGTIATSHTIVLADLTPNTVYTFRVKATDIAGNDATDDNAGSGYTFTTRGGPIITDVTTILTDDTNATIEWNTNENTDSRLVYAVTSSALTSGVGTTAVADTSFVGGDGPLYQHRIALTGLTPRTTYYYYVQSTDVDGNAGVDKNGLNYYTFTTSYDRKAPNVSAITTPVITETAVVVLWKTNELADSQVSYGTTSGSYTKTTTLDTNMSIVHAVTLTGLTGATKYYYVVKSSDPAGNATTSAEQTVTSASAQEVQIVTIGGGAGKTDNPPPDVKDTTPASISNIAVASTTAFSAVLSFETSEPTVIGLRYGRTATYDRAEASIDWKRSHEIRLSGLRLGSEYHYQIKAIDKGGNESFSDDLTFTTKFVSEASETARTLENLQQYEQEIEESLASILPSILPPFVEEAQVTDITESTATVNWRTNINSYATLTYSTEADFLAATTTRAVYTAEVSDITSKTRDHSLVLIGLKPNTTYHFKARSFSVPQVVGEGRDMTFTTKAPAVQASVIDVKTTSFRAAWTTEAPASSIVEYKNLTTGVIERIIKEPLETYHDILVENLRPGTRYEVKVLGYTSTGNLLASGSAINVLTSTDISAPKISNFKVDGALVPGRTDRIQTIVSWTTDEPGTGIVEYQEGAGSVADGFANKVTITDSYVTNHVVILANLKPGTIYQFKITSADQAGNTASFGPRTIITPQKGESIFDVIFKNFEDTFKFLRGAGQ